MKSKKICSICKKPVKEGEYWVAAFTSSREKKGDITCDPCNDSLMLDIITDDPRLRILDTGEKE